ncbi:MAG: carboxylate-amine ligase [Gammaproteobacteria bacterium]|nr:carboxylate-amine ligase [Gammaproteobacteria bacterium]
MFNKPSFTIGIEEEYLLVDRESRNLISEVPESMLPDCEALLEGQVTPEFFQSQIEVGTRVCSSIREARADLARLRRTVARVAEQHGMAVMAASTHPFADWESLRRTRKDRYAVLEHDLQGVVRRLMISGMHVHVGIDDEDLRIDLMNQANYLLPHLLALSTSSPFWRGEDTGLKSYRIAVWNEMPRTGLPEQFDSYGEYQRYVKVMINAGLIEDSTKIWWDIRPSHRFPTLEMRIADLCTRLDDAVCIASIYLCWLRMLYRIKVRNQRWRTYSRFLIDENRWLAQRYGVDHGLVDFGRGSVVPFSELLEEMFELVYEDAEYFDCVDELHHAREIVKRGTSAHWQVQTYQRAREEGATDEEALKAVVDMLITETMHGI